MALICGTTPDASVLRRKMSAYPPRLTTPSWMRAPPESFSPMIGAPFFSARSMILTIFSACASESEPPKTVKSWLKTKTSRRSEEHTSELQSRENLVCRLLLEKKKKKVKRKTREYEEHYKKQDS